MRELIQEIEDRYPLLRDLYVAASSSPSAEHIPHLIGLLLSIAERESDDRSCCLVLPESESVTPMAAVALALICLRRDFDKFAYTYAEHGLKVGTRVRVNPSGHVYLYDGIFTDLPYSRGRHLFKLRVLDTSDARSLPIDQVLRLEPTALQRPKGKVTTKLGSPELSNLDKLLGLRSGGNDSLYKNRILLLSSLSGFKQFLNTVEISRHENADESQRSRLSTILPWGTIKEDGDLIHADPGLVCGEPILAVTHSIYYLKAACARIREKRAIPPIIIVDGSHHLIRNLQAFDEVTKSNRMLIVDDESNQQDLAHLEARDCLVWRVLPEEVLLGQNNQKSFLFKRAFQAAETSRDLKIDAQPCIDEHLESIADGLIQASKLLQRHDGLEETKRCLKHLFGLLFRASDRLTPLTESEQTTLLADLNGLKQKLREQAIWAPSDVMKTLKNVCEQLRKVFNSDCLGSKKRDVLLCFLNETKVDHSGVIIVTRDQQGAVPVRGWLRDQGFHITVTSDRYFPEEKSFEHIILVSWLNTDRFRRLVKRFAAPHITLLAYPFEREWIRQFKVRFDRERSLGNLGRKQKSAVLNVPEEALQYKHITEGDQETSEIISPEISSVFAIEKSFINRRKRLPSQSYHSDDTVEAHYVGFVGSTFSYLTAGHALPVVTHLVRESDIDRRDIPQRTIQDLRIGDFVLFRDGSDHDVIQLFAEDLMGSERYAKAWALATSWREPLLSCGETSHEIYRHLKHAGLERHYVTVRNWLYNEHLIGPKESGDLKIIETVAGTFPHSWEVIWEAIETIRGCHTSAGFEISKWLLSEISDQLDSIADDEICLDLDFGRLWIVEIEEISVEKEKVPLSQANRLLWD